MTTAELTTEATRIEPGDRRVRQGTRAGAITTNVVLAVGALYTLLPLLWLLLAATKNAEALFSSNLLDFANFDLVGNIRALIDEDDGLYLRWYANTVLYAVIGAGVGALISTAAGYVFDKYEFRGKRQLYALVLISVMIPGTVLALPMYLIASQLGLANTMWAVFITVLFNPFGVYLARIFATGYVPGEVLEAARVDGASELHIFFRIGLRMLGPGFVTVFLFQLTSIWNNFFLPLVMLSDEKLYPISLGLYAWNSQATITPEYYPLVVIGSLLALIPLIVAFLLLQRYWRSGLTAGSVK
jgi:multiple sugar transport system permease protein